VLGAAAVVGVHRGNHPVVGVRPEVFDVDQHQNAGVAARARQRVVHGQDALLRAGLLHACLGKRGAKPFLEELAHLLLGLPHVRDHQ